MVGEGIFTNDGQAWSQSRKLLRPSFEPSKVRKFSIIDNHTNMLIQSVPKNSTVDLQKLFYTFTTNSTTDFLLGNTSTGAGFTFEDEFGEEFDRCVNQIGGGGKMMTLESPKNSGYERDVKFIHGSITSTLFNQTKANMHFRL